MSEKKKLRKWNRAGMLALCHMKNIGTLKHESGFAKPVAVDLERHEIKC